MGLFNRIFIVSVLFTALSSVAHAGENRLHAVSKMGFLPFTAKFEVTCISDCLLDFGDGSPAVEVNSVQSEIFEHTYSRQGEFVTVLKSGSINSQLHLESVVEAIDRKLISAQGNIWNELLDKDGKLYRLLSLMRDQFQAPAPSDRKLLKIGTDTPVEIIHEPCEMKEMDLDLGLFTRTFRVGLCLSHIKGSKSQDLIYFFHPLYSNETMLRNPEREQDAKDFFNRLGPNGPAVISVSFHFPKVVDDFMESVLGGVYPVWGFSDAKGLLALSGNLDVFLSQDTQNGVMGYVEKALIPSKLGFFPKNRNAMGISLGGFNSLALYMRAPQLFKQIAVHCPAITGLNAWDSPSRIKSYIENHPQKSKLMPHFDLFAKGLVGLFSGFYFSPSSWKAMDLDRIVTEKVSPNSPLLYLSFNEADSLGFTPHSQLFVKQVEAYSNHKIQSKEYWGGHCDSSALPLEQVADSFMGKQPIFVPTILRPGSRGVVASQVTFKSTPAPLEQRVQDGQDFLVYEEGAPVSLEASVLKSAGVQFDRWENLPEESSATENPVMLNSLTGERFIYALYRSGGRK